MKTPSDETPEPPEFTPIHIKGNCSLNALTPAQQQILFDWLETHSVKQVLEMVAAPPPEGFGLKTHITTLRRFHLRARWRFQSQLTEDISDLPPSHKPGLNNSDQLTLHKLREATLHNAMLHQSDPATVATLGRWMLRLKEAEYRKEELELLRARLALETRKFEFNAARQAIIHQQEIATICSNTSTDNEDKIWAAREKIFGPRSDLIEPPPRPETPSPFFP
ncbi:MAG TPA: hypothetical protein VEH27_08105 [Methylomirabilota bacterium]|nr:hypothetical protein [Methylomirabilota bacterium]